MKKRSAIFAIITILVVLLFVFTACGKDNPTDDNTEEPAQTTDIYAQINALLSKVSYPVTLTTRTTEDGYAFDGTYTVTEEGGVYSVEYSFEKLATFEITDGGIIKPDSFKKTCTGNLKVKDGKIIEQNGAQAELSVDALTVKGLSVSESTLTDVKVENGVFSAGISSAKEVTGMNTDMQDARIEIRFTEEKITRLTLSYSASSYRTEISYQFG